MKKLTFVSGGFLFGCVFAHAQFPVTDSSLPIADYSSTFQGSYGNGTYFESQSQYGVFNFSYAAISPAPGPFYNQISASSDIAGYTATTEPTIGIVGSIVPSSLSAVSLDARATLAYEFTIAGTPGTQLSVDVAGSISGNATQLTSPPIFSEAASSAFYVASSVQNLNAANALSYLSSSTQANPSGFKSSNPNNPTLTLIAGNVYYVELSAEVALNGTFGTSPTVTGSAVVDPSFTLTPDEVAAGYQIEFSPGIITPVPESSTWTPLAGGAAILLCLTRIKTFKA
jgi:hypothetical protein